MAPLSLMTRAALLDDPLALAGHLPPAKERLHVDRIALEGAHLVPQSLAFAPYLIHVAAERRASHFEFRGPAGRPHGVGRQDDGQNPDRNRPEPYARAARQPLPEGAFQRHYTPPGTPLDGKNPGD